MWRLRWWFHRKHSTILIWLIGLGVVACAATTMAPRVWAQDIYPLPGQWVTFDSKDGLPTNEVLAVWPAPDGVVWAGTASGLARFDGMNPWQAVDTGLPATSGPVRAIWGRSGQDIWVAGDAGLAHFDGDGWQQVPAQQLGLPEGPLFALWGNRQRDLWVGGQRGVAHWNGTTWQSFTNQNSALPEGAVSALTGSTDGSIVWIGTENGLATYEPASNSWRELEIKNVDLAQVEPLVRARLKGSDPIQWWVKSLWLANDVLWVGLWDGLLRHDLTTGEWAMMDGSQWDGPDMVSSIWGVGETLWLAVNRPDVMVADFEYMQILKRRGADGLRYFDGDQWQQYGEDSPLGSSRVYAIGADEGGVIWFATANGIARFDSERWRAYRSPSPLGQPVTRVRGDAAGHLFLSRQDALFAWTTEQWRREIPNAWPERRFETLWVGGPNDVWIGDTWHGAARWNGHRWAYFNQESGLAGDHVSAIWGDRSGHVWFGTSQGLSRYDNETEQWETFTRANSSLPVDWVTALWGDEQALWVGTLGSDVARIDLATGAWQTFQRVGLPSGNGPLDLVGNDVQSLALDRAGNLWVATTGGVAYYDRGEDTWQQWRSLDFLAPYEEPHAIAVAPDGIVWLTTSDGVYRYVPATGLWQRFAPERLRDSDLPLWIDPGGRIWFGATRYDPQTGEWLTVTSRDGLASNDVRAVWGDQAGAVWFATKFGVSRLADGRWQTFTAADGLTGTNTILITGDEDGNIWAATLSGVIQYSNGAWQAVLPWQGSGLIGRALYAIGAGRLWVVDPNGALYFLEGGSWQAVEVANGELAGLLSAVVEGPQGELWVGSKQGLAHRAADGPWSRINTTESTDRDHRVNAIWGDGAGTVWIATDHGLSRYASAGNAWRRYSTSDGLLADNILDIWGDTAGNIWIAQANGISKFDGTTWDTMPDTGLPVSNVNSIWVGTEGMIWVATDAGPACWDGTQWQPPPVGPESSGEVRDLWSANDGLWVVAEHAIRRFDGKQWQTLTTIEGFPASRFHHIWSDGQGTAWVGGADGLVRIDGNRWRTFPPEVALGGILDLWGRNADDIWAVTDSGVAHFDGQQWQLVYENKEATTVMGDGKDGLWLGAEKGLYHYDGVQWRDVTTETLRMPTFVTVLLQAPNGSTWVGAEKGLVRFGGPEDKMEFQMAPVRALFVSRSNTLWFAGWDQTVDRWDQRLPGVNPLATAAFTLPPTKVFDGDVRAIAEDKRGDIWFATNEGLLRHRPRPPVASIASITLATGQPTLADAQQVVLPYRHGAMTVTLVATDTGSLSSEMAFWYKLEGKDTFWTRWDVSPFKPPPGKVRQVPPYSQLAPGEYQFKYVVYNRNNESTAIQTQLLRVEEPNWWDPEHPAFPWLLGVAGLLLMGLGGGGLRTWQGRRAYGYRDAEVVVEPGGEETYRVTWQEQRTSLPSYSTQLRRSLVNSYLEIVETGQIAETDLRQLGRQLFDALWNDATRQKLLQGTRAGHKGWRVRLNFQATPELLTLPWEFAYGDVGLEYLSVNPDTAMARYLPPQEPLGRPKTKWPLDVLIVWSEPHEYASIQAEQEVGAVKTALQPLIAKHRVRLRIVPHVTLEAFTRAVSEGADVVHFIGHGAIEAGQSLLYFEDQAGDSIPQRADELATVFRGFQAFGDKAPKLVVLSACQSAASTQGSATLAGLVPTLLREGRMPAVVGMQLTVGAQVAASFAGHFYHALVSRGGGQVDYAISVARKGLYTELGAGRRDWGAPVLYMQVKDGRIFEVR
ncbi:MAG: CHAT domain-containing protein [Chloroflexi bacterium]|nr:CHAT domain-containing protein [Chloroflexota bacterium]